MEATTVKFVSTSRENNLLCIDGYELFKNKTNKDGTRIYWECTKRRERKCNFRAITENGEVVSTTPTGHSHGPDPAKIVAREVCNQIRQTAKSGNARPGEIGLKRNCVSQCF